jgi:hypothetical protein
LGAAGKLVRVGGLAGDVVPSAGRSTGGLPGKLVGVGGLAGRSTGGLPGKLPGVGGLAGRSTGGLPGKLGRVEGLAGRSSGGLPGKLGRVGGLAGRSSRGLPGNLVGVGGLAGRSTGGLPGNLGRVGGLAGDVVLSAGRSTGGLPGRLVRVGGRGGVRGKGLTVWSPSAWSPFVGVFFVFYLYAPCPPPAHPGPSRLWNSVFSRMLLSACKVTASVTCTQGSAIQFSAVKRTKKGLLNLVISDSKEDVSVTTKH